MHVLLLLTVLSAAPQKLATLERTTCFGSCPSYVVTVFTDGRVEWQGRNFVKVKGAASKQLSEDALAQLKRAFTAINYMKLGSGFDCYERTDHPSALTSFNDGTTTKTIEHYYGCTSKKGVEQLTALEARFDEVVGTAQWVR